MSFFDIHHLCVDADQLTELRDAPHHDQIGSVRPPRGNCLSLVQFPAPGLGINDTFVEDLYILRLQQFGRQPLVNGFPNLGLIGATVDFKRQDGDFSHILGNGFREQKTDQGNDNANPDERAFLIHGNRSSRP